MGDQLIQNLKRKLGEAVEIVVVDLATVRTGRAKPSLIENVKVEAYGSMMGMREVASINTPDPSLLIVSPWDKGLIEAVEKAIRDADLGLSPVVDGEQIKIPIPVLTEERRKELVKLVSQKIESGRVLIRQIRGESKEDIEKFKDEPGVSEDDIHRWLEEMQRAVDEYTEKIEELGKEKEKDLMTI